MNLFNKNNNFLKQNLLSTVPSMRYLSDIEKTIELIEHSRSSRVKLIFCAFGSSHHAINIVINAFGKNEYDIELINSPSDISTKEYLLKSLKSENTWIIFASRSGKTFEIVSKLEHLLSGSQPDNIKRVIVLTSMYTQNPCSALVRRYDISYLNINMGQCGRFEIFNSIYFFIMRLIVGKSFNLKKEHNKVTNCILKLNDFTSSIKINHKKQLIVINNFWRLNNVTNWFKYLWNESFGGLNVKNAEFYNYDEFFHSGLQKYQLPKSNNYTVIILTNSLTEKNSITNKYASQLFSDIHFLYIEIDNLPSLFIYAMNFLFYYAKHYQANILTQEAIDQFKLICLKNFQNHYQCIFQNT